MGPSSGPGFDTDQARDGSSGSRPSGQGVTSTHGSYPELGSSPYLLQEPDAATTVLDPVAGVRSAAARLREVADELDGATRSIRASARVDEVSMRILADAVTHVRLTAEALEHVVG